MTNKEIEVMYREKLGLRHADQVDVKFLSMYFDVSEYIITDYITQPYPFNGVTTFKGGDTFIRKTQIFVKRGEITKFNVLLDVVSDDYREENVKELESIIDFVNAKPELCKEL